MKQVADQGVIEAIVVLLDGVGRCAYPVARGSHLRTSRTLPQAILEPITWLSWRDRGGVNQPTTRDEVWSLTPAGRLKRG